MISLFIEHPNTETLELIISQIKEIELMGLAVRTITFENVTDSNLKSKGFRWTWEIESSKELNDKEIRSIAMLLDPEYDWDINTEYNEGTKTYKFILENC
nr:MAG TPA: hypothetical protein [Caudoviricetes sp.]